MAEHMNPVCWFEIPATDLKRAKKFYESLFGIELSENMVGSLKMAWFPVMRGAPGAAGALVKAEGYVPSRTGCLIYFTVEDIDAVLANVKANGGKTLLPRTVIGDYGCIAQFEDCEGNKVALHSNC